ncbi:hypothetical protein ACWEFL_15060 [Streptomyces sp. NPDC004838]
MRDSVARRLVTWPRRLPPETEAIVRVTWWAALTTGLALLGVIVHGDLAHAQGCNSVTEGALDSASAADVHDNATQVDSFPGVLLAREGAQQHF